MVLSSSSDHAAFTVPHVSRSSPASVHLILEVTRGRTRFRRRPVTSSRFLIGAGNTCDLRLGGEQMPALHSIITIGPHEVALEAIVAEPVLSVNGRPIRTAVLHDGDVIGIGDVELLARLEAGHAPAGAQTHAPAIVEDVPEPVAGDLSAAELVDRLEREIDTIEQFDSRRRVGADALVHAVRSRQTPALEQSPMRQSPAIQAPHFLTKRPQILAAQNRSIPAGQSVAPATEAIPDRELEQLTRHLETLTEELHNTARRATYREAGYASATDGLLEAQQKLATQLEALLTQVETLKSRQTPTLKTRQIA